MPAIYDSLLKHNHEKPHVAWRVSFIVPFILITATAIALLICCPDTPTGRWADRASAAQHNLQAHVPGVTVVDAPTGAIDEKGHLAGTESPTSMEKESKVTHTVGGGGEVHLGEQEMVTVAQGEIVVKPTFKEAMHVIFSLQTLTLAACYFCTFGAELAINSILGAYYLKNFPKLGQTGTGRWAAMFGLLNVVCRPFGGFVSDALYKRTKSTWSKKIWTHALAIIDGCFLLAIGLKNSKHDTTMFGLVAGMALFLEGSNGALFSLVPHVHPFANGKHSSSLSILSIPTRILTNTSPSGIVSGVTGAAGNLGGIVFAIIFRYNGVKYGRVFWIIGVITICLNLAVCWITPIPKRQVGGR
jgi:NNP family nitrate/nitrite transporter-like MFS transporter